MNDNKNSPRRADSHSAVYKLTVSAVFLAFTIVLKLTTTFYLPIMGASGLKIDFSGIFSAFPSILFGPWYGGAVCAAADVLAHFIKPNGAFIPLLTVTQFISGFLIGIAARLLRSDGRTILTKRITIIVCVLLVLTGTLGICCHVSLNSDGIINGLTPEVDSLPSKGEIQSAASLSPLTRVTVSLARYSSDSLTITEADSNKEAKMLLIPETLAEDGISVKVTTLSDTAFAGLTLLDTIYIPSDITTIADTAFADCSDDLMIYTPAGSAAAAFAHKFEVGCCELSESEDKAFRELYGYGRENWNPASYTSNNNYRRNLSGYITFMTIGLEGIALFGLIFIALGILLKKSDNRYILFLTIISPARLIITTINTEILRRTMAIWNGRTFWILLIPRLGEEIVGCLIQAYIIALLYAVYESRIAPKLNK